VLATAVESGIEIVAAAAVILISLRIGFSLFISAIVELETMTGLHLKSRATATVIPA
jgi:hypothetical protein